MTIRLTPAQRAFLASYVCEFPAGTFPSAESGASSEEIMAAREAFASDQSMDFDGNATTGEIRVAQNLKDLGLLDTVDAHHPVTLRAPGGALRADKVSQSDGPGYLYVEFTRLGLEALFDVAIAMPPVEVATGLREDLRLCHAAARAGWFLDWEHPDNPITFCRNDVHVWQTGRDWRARTLKDVTYEGPARSYPLGFAGLLAALENESGQKVNFQVLTDAQVGAIKKDWIISEERDYAAHRDNAPGGDGAVHLVATATGDWAVTKGRVSNVIAEYEDPLEAIEVAFEGGKAASPSP